MTDPTVPKQPKTVTREDLFRQVWSKPMSHLAKEYGLSDRGLAKICAKMDVPCPPRGYWAKVEAGQKVITYRLPPAKDDTLRRMTISPTPPPPAPPSLSPEVKAKVKKIHDAKASFTVPARLNRPHTIIAAWLDDHEARKRRAKLESNSFFRNSDAPGEFTEIDRRKHRILDTILKALESQGVKVTEANGRELVANMGLEHLEFQIREKLKQVRVALTPDQLRWSYGTKTRQELHPTGFLLIATKTYLPASLRREWLESAEERLEDLVPDIVATFITALGAMAKARRERAEQEHLRYLENLRRQEEQQRRKRDSNQWRKFVDLASKRREILLAQEFLQTIKSMSTDTALLIEDRSLSDWIAWAEDNLARNDPLENGAEGVFSVISGVTYKTYD